MKKILILGGTGFIGRNLREYLSAKGKYEVLSPTRNELNLLCEREVDSYFEKNKIDIVFHCGIFVPKSIQEQEKIIENDLRMFYNVSKHCNKYEKMIYIGSGAEFGKNQDICQVSEKEIGRRIPIDAYGFAKYVIGREIDNSQNIYNFRIWGLFGKYEDWWTTFISGCCCKAIKRYPISIRKDTYFDYLWIDDFCKVLEWAIEHELIFHTYNVGSGSRVLLSDIAKYVKRISGNNVDIIICNDGLGLEYTTDNTRLLNEFGEKYATSLFESIACVYEWYEQHEELINMQKLIYNT